MIKTDNISGTSYKAEILTNYADLVKTFGEPHVVGSGDDKVRATWAFKVGDDWMDGQYPRGGLLKDTVITIYDWKEYNTPVEQVTEWHIGGDNGQGEAMAKLVCDILIKGGSIASPVNKNF